MDRRALILFGLLIGVAAWAFVPVSGAGDGFGRGVGAQTEVSLLKSILCRRAADLLACLGNLYC